MTSTIYFDGMNLGLKRGTGVATYGRVLAQLTQSLGHRTGVLYTLHRDLPERPLDREVAFFDDDAYTMPAFGKRLYHASSIASGLVTAAFGVRPQQLVRNGVVVTRPFDATWVESDDIFSSRDIFDRARAFYTLSRSFLPVQFRTRPDIFHWTYPLPMRANARANLYTVHDLVPVRLPYTTLDWKRYYIHSMRKILRKADHIVTVSEHSKRDIMALFGVEERRITNTYQAVNIPKAYLERPKDAIAAELAGVFGLDHGGYLLFYGSLEPKKNVQRIVQAYLASGVKLPLVIVMAQNWQSDEEARLLNQILDEDRVYDRSKERRRIRRYEYLPFRLLTTLIQGARALVFPSLYEGFGLPVLEAMTMGTPVITSNTASIPEIAGDACLCVDPYSVDAIRDAITAVCHDDDLRAGMSQKGLERAKLFSPEIYRGRIAELYKAYL
jgi:glycosyltransferase involved in cell wall biosynthesis